MGEWYGRQITWYWICPGGGGRRNPSVSSSVSKEVLIKVDFEGPGAGGEVLPWLGMGCSVPGGETRERQSLRMNPRNKTCVLAWWACCEMKLTFAEYWWLAWSYSKGFTFTTSFNPCSCSTRSELFSLPFYR